MSINEKGAKRREVENESYMCVHIWQFPSNWLLRYFFLFSDVMF